GRNRTAAGVSRSTGMRSVPTDHKCETREAFSIRYTPTPTDQTQTERCGPRPTVRNAELRAAFPLLSCCMEPPAGIEPATPSFPWNHQEPLCGTPFPQVTPNRKGRSYRFSFDEVMRSHQAIR